MSVLIVLLAAQWQINAARIVIGLVVLVALWGIVQPRKIK